MSDDMQRCLILILITKRTMGKVRILLKQQQQQLNRRKAEENYRNIERKDNNEKREINIIFCVSLYVCCIYFHTRIM